MRIHQRMNGSEQLHGSKILSFPLIYFDHTPLCSSSLSMRMDGSKGQLSARPILNFKLKIKKLLFNLKF